MFKNASKRCKAGGKKCFTITFAKPSQNTKKQLGSNKLKLSEQEAISAK